MAYTSGNLALLSQGKGHNEYFYDAGSDTLATVMVSGYFNNTDDSLNLAADDEIGVKAADGFEVLRVDTVSSGVVTTEIGMGGSQWIGITIADVSSAGSVWLAAPFDGFIRRFKTVLGGVITIGDAAVGLELGGADVTGGQVTVAQSGSAAGVVDATVATAANAVSEGDAVEIDADGGSTNVVALYCYVEFMPG